MRPKKLLRNQYKRYQGKTNNTPFTKMVTEFINDHKDVLQELSRR